MKLVYHKQVTNLQTNSAPQSKNALYVHFGSHAEHVLLLWKIPEEISR